MRILISTIFWGKDYFDNFAGYSLPSILSENNAPLVSKTHPITLLVLTERRFIDAFKKEAVYRQSSDIIHYDFRALEEYGFNTTRIPGGFDGKKYQFLSVCQNIAIGLSLTYDIHIFNYADFIWADGALGNIILQFRQYDIFALLGFCIPVDEDSVKPVLSANKIKNHGAINLQSSRAVGIALDHMHPEARERNWESRHIHNFPSYLYWEVEKEGVIVRAFHQTLIATAPMRGSQVYNAGITHGTLDGNFSSEISRAEKTRMATDSDAIFIFSMYRAFLKFPPRRKSKAETMRAFAGAHLKPEHLINFQTPIRMKRIETTQEALWEQKEEASLQVLEFIKDCVHGAPANLDAEVGVLASWKNPKAFSAARSFASSWIAPRIQYLIQGCINVSRRCIWALRHQCIRLIRKIVGR